MNRSIEQVHENVTKIAVRIVGISLAIILGLAAGAGNYPQVGKIFFLIAALFYVLFIQQFTWKLIYFIGALGLTYAPAGFAFGAGEIACSFLFCLFAATWWRKENPQRPIEVEQLPFKLFNVCLISWIVYNGIHLFYTIWNPYWAGDIAINNLLKVYMAWAGLPLATLYFMHHPRPIQVKPNFPNTIGILLFICLVLNLLIRLYAFYTGRYGGDDSLTKEEISNSMFYIPFIGASENPFVFRGLGPSAMLISTIFLSSEWIKTQPWSQKLLFYICFSIGVIGTIMGGGRVSILVASASILFVFLVQKKYGRLFLLGILSIIAIALANLAYHTGTMNHLPPVILRSSAILIFNKNEDAKAALQGSNDWRQELFLRSLEEWRSDSRIFWFGRSTYSFGYADEVDIRQRAGEGVMTSTLRRGNTHNLITDMLVIYGLVGFISFMAVIGSFLWFTWRIYRDHSNPNIEPAVRSLALFAFIGTGTGVSYALIAGGGGMFDGLSLLLIMSRLYAAKDAAAISIVRKPEWPNPPNLDHSFKSVTFPMGEESFQDRP